MNLVALSVLFNNLQIFDNSLSKREQEIVLHLMNAGYLTVNRYGCFKACSPDTLYNVTKEEEQAGIEEGKVRAVIMYKKRTGCGLVESKNAIETYFREHNISFKNYT